ncbi:hypothetical protein L9F63_002435 [Diploptera punctata]|uniref:Uncharacterized protein n=1 Tax=Diploptera punctata TaxID=6984 RepID=A0AAD7ZS97_DIPPU|nr:hypothetical protein L9F63_002435 [Diploptera punctata]
MAKEKYLTEEELVNILYNDDSGDELISELEDSQSESEDELPLPEIVTPIPCDIFSYVLIFLFIRTTKSSDRTNEDQLSPVCFDSTEGSFDGAHLIDDILTEYGDYGTTPPRTRISRRQRERRQREREEYG